MIDLFFRGGLVMYPLAFCSVLAVYILVERLLFLFFNRVPGQSSIDQARSLLLSTGRHRAANDLQNNARLGVRLLGVAIRSSHLPHNELNDDIKSATHFELPKLDKNMNALATIITAAPLLGLLGTVLGLMNLFGVLGGSVNSVVNPLALLGGISEALITTVTGLAIALATMLFNQFLLSRIDAFVFNVEKQMLDIVNFCKQNEVRE